MGLAALSRLLPLRQVCQALLVVLSSLTYLGAQTGNWQVLEGSENGAALCPNNTPLSAVQITSVPWKHYLHTWKIFCQAYHESPVQYEDGGWEREHSIYRKTFQLHCPDNKFISGFYTNYSERYLDHIWWLHCSSLDHSHFISNCSQVHQEHLLTPNRTASFFLPANLTVFTAVHSIYHRELLSRTWGFTVCSFQDYCSPGSQASTPSGVIITEANSSLLFHCPVGKYLNGSTSLSCPLNPNTTFPTCQVCASIKFCEQVSCTSLEFSVCIKCMDYHPKLKLPIVPNKRRRKCRVPPVISQFPDEIKFTERDNISLECLARGIPRPRIQWLYNGESLTNGSIESLIVQITNITEAGAGTYTCIATNAVGTDSKNITLTHVSLPTAMSPPPLLAIIGEEAVLICQVTGYETIHWLNCSDNGRLLTSNSSRVTLHNDSLVLRIYPVHRSDSGVFGCIASNRAGSVSVNIVMHTLDTAHLKELFSSGSGSGLLATPPTIVNWTANYTVMEGDTVDMNCQAVGNPTPVVYWQHGEHILSSGRGQVRLVLEEVTMDRAGEYICTASSMYQIYSVMELSALLKVITVPTPTHSTLTTTDLLQSMASLSSSRELTTTLPYGSLLPTDPSAGCHTRHLAPLITLTAVIAAVLLQ